MLRAEIRLPTFMFYLFGSSCVVAGSDGEFYFFSRFFFFGDGGGRGRFRPSVVLFCFFFSLPLNYLSNHRHSMDVFVVVEILLLVDGSFSRLERFSEQQQQQKLLPGDYFLLLLKLGLYNNNLDRTGPRNKRAN